MEGLLGHHGRGDPIVTACQHPWAACAAATSWAGWTTPTSPRPGWSSSRPGCRRGAAGVTEPNAMVLATAAADGRPSARTVLLKGLDERGCSSSRTWGRARAASCANPCASSCSRGRPAAPGRVDGTVAPVGRRGADAYFASRPCGSQVGGRASPQSPRHRLAGGAAGGPRRGRRRHPDGAGAAPRALGRLRVGPETRRVLAGPPRPPARPAGLPAHERGGLGRRAPLGALTGALRAARRAGPRSGGARGPRAPRTTPSAPRGRGRTAGRR